MIEMLKNIVEMVGHMHEHMRNFSREIQTKESN